MGGGGERVSEEFFSETSIIESFLVGKIDINDASIRLPEPQIEKKQVTSHVMKPHSL